MMTTNDDACFVIHFHDDEAPAGYTYMSVLLQKISMVHNTWYDFKIVVDTTKLSTAPNGAINGVTTYRREKGTENWIGCGHLGANYLTGTNEYAAKCRYFLNRTSIGSANSIGFSFNASYHPDAVTTDTVYYIDNFRLNNYESSFVGEVWFEDEDGEWAQTIHDGEVTPIYQIENYGGLTSATAVTVVYDADNRMVTSKSTDITLNEASATVEVEGATVDASIVGEGGRIEAYLWDGWFNLWCTWYSGRNGFISHNSRYRRNNW